MSHKQRYSFALATARTHQNKYLSDDGIYRGAGYRSIAFGTWKPWMANSNNHHRLLPSEGTAAAATHCSDAHHYPLSTSTAQQQRTTNNIFRNNMNALATAKKPPAIQGSVFVFFIL
jgi:hypothetical protein